MFLAVFPIFICSGGDERVDEASEKKGWRKMPSGFVILRHSRCNSDILSETHGWAGEGTECAKADEDKHIRCLNVIHEAR